MISLSFVNFKGGVTKTSSSVGLGAALARNNYKVLLVDCDPQGHVSVNMGIERDKLTLGLENILGQKGRLLKEIIIESSVKNLWVAPSRRELLYARSNLAEKPNRDAMLAKASNGLTDHFDFMVIDSPPDEGILSVNAMYASNYIIIPTILDTLALDGINPLLDTIISIQDAYEERNIGLLGILINRYDERLQIENKANMNILLDAFGNENLIFKTKIRVDEEIRKAQRAGQTIFQKNIKSKGAKDFENLAKEVVKKIAHN